MKDLAFPILLLCFCSCLDNSKQQDIPAIVSDYYETYKKRENFNMFLDFYDENMVLEDMVSGDRKVGKEEFAEFFNWDHPSFMLLDSVSMVIENQIIDGYEVVTQGHFTPFKWDSTRVDAMHFTSILTFNQKGKIIKQVDWINYPSYLIDYQKRKDSNSWINNRN